MTPEQLLLSALSVVSTVLSVLGKIVWAEIKECKVERRELRVESRQLREELEDVREKVGLNSGRLQAVERCPVSGCPFRSMPHPHPSTS